MILSGQVHHNARLRHRAACGYVPRVLAHSFCEHFYSPRDKAPVGWLTRHWALTLGGQEDGVRFSRFM